MSKPICESLESAYRKLDQELLAATVGASTVLSDSAGSTSTTVIVTPDHFIFAHIGDSSAMLVRNLKVFHSTRRHNVTDAAELERISRTTARVKGERVFPASGRRGIAVTRCFGDFFLKGEKGLAQKMQAVVCEPEITTINRNPKDDFIIVASDGFWDVISDDDAIARMIFIVNSGFKENLSMVKIARQMVALAYACRSADNISVILLKL